MRRKYTLHCSTVQLSKHFSEIADNYAAAAFVADEIAKCLTQNLSIFQLDPQLILDIGCGTGQAATLVKNLYPQAKIIGLDIALPMLQRLNQFILPLCADIHQVPIRSATLDLIIMNIALPWCGLPEKLFSSCKKLLKPKGLLIFSMYGPDTCQEIGSLSDLIDMHLIGDFIQTAGFADSVLERQFINVRYAQIPQMLNDLRQQGWQFYFPNLINALPSGLELTHEVIIGHAWAPQDYAVSVPISKISRRPYSPSTA